jgi:hypothetical protein
MPSILTRSVVLAAVLAAPLAAQEASSPPSRVTIDLAAGMSRFGSHTFGALDVSMKRWLAFRTELLFGGQDRPEGPSSIRAAMLTLGGVATLAPGKRVTPYVLGGFSSSALQGDGFDVGPMAGAGIRLRIRGIQPFLETRVQHRLGAPISFGVRFQR